MTTRHIAYDDAIGHLTWRDAVEALREGHRRPKAQIADMFLGPSDGTLLSRGAWIEGLGYGVKSVTVFDGNKRVGLPTVQGAMLVFGPEDGQLIAIIESRLVTEVKTAADSVLGATLLARPDSRHLLIVGGGTVARSLIDAYSELFPGLERISVWTRRPEQALELVSRYSNNDLPVVAVSDLPSTVCEADIISCATIAREPVLYGEWIRPGTHVDLIGAFKADMREADDQLMSRASLFVDSRDTTVHHIGELMIPLASGVIAETDVLGDLYELVFKDRTGRQSPEEITLFKNGGGAHLDLMIATFISLRLGATR